MLHGPGARRRVRPIMRTVQLPRGGSRRQVVRRETFYTCDLIPGGRNRMRQTLLSFVTTRADDRRGDDGNTSPGDSFDPDLGGDAAE